MRKSGEYRCRDWITRRRCALVAACACLYVLVAGSAHGQFSVLLSPQLVSVQLRPGSRTVMEFGLTNQDKDKPVSVRVSLKDIEQGIRGEYGLSDTATPYSCLSWLTLEDSLIEIGPGELKQVPVKVEVPFRAMGGAYGAIVFEIVPPKKESRGGEGMPVGFEYRFQLPSWIEIEVKRPQGSQRRLMAGELEIKPKIEEPELEKELGTRGMEVRLTAQNTGNVHVTTQGRVIIRDEKKQLVKDTRLGAGRGILLPGAKTQLRTIMPLLQPGKYTVKTIVNYGGRSPAVTQSEFTIGAESVSRLGGTKAAVPLYVEFSPERLEQSVPAGGFRVAGISVMNRDTVPVRIDVALQQVFHGRTGQLWVLEGQPDTGRSCIPWLSVTPPQFTLEPNRRQNLRLELSVPQGASGGYYGCVVLEARPAADTATSMLPLPMYFPIYMSVPPDLKRSGEVAEIEVDRGRGTSATLKAEFHNTGNIHLLLRGNARIQRWTEPGSVEGLTVLDTARFEDVTTVPLETDSIFVLPGGVRMVSSQTVEGLPAGRYRAYVTVQYGGQKPATLEREFVIRETEEPAQK